MPEAVITFKTDGSVEVQDEKGNAEKNLAWLLKDLGDVERRGHKGGHHHEEGINVQTGQG